MSPGTRPPRGRAGTLGLVVVLPPDGAGAAGDAAVTAGEVCGSAVGVDPGGATSCTALTAAAGTAWAAGGTDAAAPPTAGPASTPRATTPTAARSTKGEAASA